MHRTTNMFPGLVLVMLAAGIAQGHGGPDLRISGISTASRWGVESGVGAYSFGFSTCNLGTEASLWRENTAQHPAFAQNVFRIRAGMIEQIGLGLVVHGQCPLQTSGCGTCVPAAGMCEALGVGCMSTDSASFAALQANMGLRSEVNPATGVLTYPFSGMGSSGGPLFKRVRIASADLDLAQHVGATYLAETLVVAENEAEDHRDNNASCRVMTPGAFSETQGYALNLTGSTQAAAAIVFWAALDQTVTLTRIDVPGDGLMWLGSRATPNGDGTWTYAYALYNQNSDRGARSLRVTSAGVTFGDFGFRDIEHHSGEPFDGADWAVAAAPGTASWATQGFSDNPNANALRWGTLYNFRFTADAPPATRNIEIGLFKPGAFQTITAAARVPVAVPPPCQGDATGDRAVNFQDVSSVLGNFGRTMPPGTASQGDANFDGVVNFVDVTVVLVRFGFVCP